MLMSGRRLLRLIVALALLGAGPGVSLADVVMFHGGAAPIAATHQVDDGTTPLPHGDACHLALPSAPALDAVTPVRAPVAEAASVEGPVAPSPAVPACRAARPPPSRAPPLLQA